MIKGITGVKAWVDMAGRFIAFGGVFLHLNGDAMELRLVVLDPAIDSNMAI